MRVRYTQLSGACQRLLLRFLEGLHGRAWPSARVGLWPHIMRLLFRVPQFLGRLALHGINTWQVQLVQFFSAFGDL